MRNDWDTCNHAKKTNMYINHSDTRHQAVD